MARGYFDPWSAIAVRVLTRDPARPSTRRSSSAACAVLERGSSLIDFSDTNAFRLVHGEGDGLPGVVVDLYDGWAVMKLYSAGLTPHRPLIVEALQKTVPGLKGVVGRDEVGRDDADVDEEPRARGACCGAPRRPKPLHHRRARREVPGRRLRAARRPGFFLDQRENRFLMRRISKGLDVLNCFCFSGGFSVNAALGGAKSVFSVDQDADAIALARENFPLNGLEPATHDFLAADAFELLDSFKREGRKFDLIILDPPAFAKSQKAVESALAGYASLNRQALAVLQAQGGLLATASCSARVTPEAFFDAPSKKAPSTPASISRWSKSATSRLITQLRLQFPEGQVPQVLRAPRRG